MEGIFLSYRRKDTADDAQRIYERLAGQFGDELVFLDIEDISLGDDFVDSISNALESAAYVLIAIGPRWLLVTDENGARRLDDPDDMVRYEIKTALANKKRVVPMLIGGARMPHKRELPVDIAALVRRNGLAIRPDPDFEADVSELMNGLHPDRIDAARVPTVFRVGRVARNLGLGGAIGWGALGILGAVFSSANLAWLIMPFSGLVSGFSGGAFVGWLTGLIIRKKSPPLVGRKLVRMGVIWSLGLTLCVVVAGVIGYYVGMQFLDMPPPETDSFGQAIAAIFVQALMGVIVLVLTIFMISVIGLLTGSALAGAFFARQFRLRSDQISGGRAVAIAFVWLLGGLLTGALFVSGLVILSPS